MNHSSEFCRAQEAMHQERAQSGNLANARNVAFAAAQAWGREADLAAAAERRRGKPLLSPQDMEIAAEFALEDAEARNAEA